VPNTYYITTPIYYVNDKPHLGHAYTSVACDAIARYMRLDGMEVKFLTGTDEHGQKVEKSAAAAGVPPQAFVDEVSEHFREMAHTLNLTNDDFIRTTEPRHKEAAQALWKKLEAAGDIYLGGYAGWYATRDEAFYQESELVNGKAPTGADVEWVEEPSYFFRLSKYQQPLLDFYAANPDFILPESRRNEVLSFVKGGLKDLSISRTTFNWGIPVPGDEKHIMYVWLDALTNYWTAADGKWPADLHMVGKDILRFHAVYWPAFLMSAKLADTMERELALTQVMVVFRKVADERYSQHGQVMRCRNMLCTWPAGRIRKVRVGHANGFGSGVHLLSECFLRTCNPLGRHHAGIVTGLDGNATNQIFERYLAIDRKKHGTATVVPVHPCFFGHRELAVGGKSALFQTIENDVQRHHFGHRRGIHFFIGGLAGQNRTSVIIHKVHMACGGLECAAICRFGWHGRCFGAQA
jgi:hypothetical protein